MFNSLNEVLSNNAREVFKFEEQEKLHEDIIDSGLAKIYQSHLDIAKRIAQEKNIEKENMNKRIAFFTGIVLVYSYVSALWADPKRGEEFFKSVEGGNCMTCHYLDDKRLVGPGLQNVTKRHSDEWLKGFLKDPQAMWSSDHEETLDLRKRVHKKRNKYTSCKKPENITQEQIQDLMDYLKTLEK